MFLFGGNCDGKFVGLVSTPTPAVVQMEVAHRGG